MALSDFATPGSNPEALLASILAKVDRGGVEDYTENVVPERIFKNKQFLNDLRAFYYERDGYVIPDDDELIEKFYNDRNWRDLNTVSIARDVADAYTMSPEQAARFARIQKVWEQLPSFWREGGRGAEALGDIVPALIADPANLFGFGAGAKVGAAAAAQALKQGATSAAARRAAALAAARKGALVEGGINAGIAGAADVGIQARNIELGLQDEFSKAQLLASTGLGGVAGAVPGGLLGAASGANAARLVSQIAEAEARGDLATAARLRAQLQSQVDAGQPFSRVVGRGARQEDLVPSFVPEQPPAPEPTPPPEPLPPLTSVMPTQPPQPRTSLDLLEDYYTSVVDSLSKESRDDPAAAAEFAEQLAEAQAMLVEVRSMRQVDRLIAQKENELAKAKDLDRVKELNAEIVALRLEKQRIEALAGDRATLDAEIRRRIREQTDAERQLDLFAEPKSKTAEAGEGEAGTPQQPDAATPEGQPAKPAEAAEQPDQAQLQLDEPKSQDGQPAPSQASAPAVQQPAAPVLRSTNDFVNALIEDGAANKKEARAQLRQIAKDLGVDIRTNEGKAAVNDFINQRRARSNALARILEVEAQPEMEALREAVDPAVFAEVLRARFANEMQDPTFAEVLEAYLREQSDPALAAPRFVRKGDDNVLREVIESVQNRLSDLSIETQGAAIAKLRRYYERLTAPMAGAKITTPNMTAQLTPAAREALARLKADTLVQLAREAAERGRMRADTPLGRIDEETAYTTTGKTTVVRTDKLTGEKKEVQKTQSILRGSGKFGYQGRLPRGQTGAQEAAADLARRGADVSVQKVAAPASLKTADGVRVKKGAQVFLYKPADGPARYYARETNIPGHSAAPIQRGAKPAIEIIYQQRARTRVSRERGIAPRERGSYSEETRDLMEAGEIGPNVREYDEGEPIGPDITTAELNKIDRIVRFRDAKDLGRRTGKVVEFTVEKYLDAASRQAAEEAARQYSQDRMAARLGDILEEAAEELGVQTGVTRTAEPVVPPPPVEPMEGFVTADGVKLREGDLAYYDPRTDKVYKNPNAIPAEAPQQAAPEPQPAIDPQAAIRAAVERFRQDGDQAKLQAAIQAALRGDTEAVQAVQSKAAYTQADVPPGRRLAVLHPPSGQIRILSEKSGPEVDSAVMIGRGIVAGRAVKDEWVVGHVPEGVRGASAVPQFEPFPGQPDVGRAAPAPAEPGPAAPTKTRLPNLSEIESDPILVGGEQTTIGEALREIDELERAEWPATHSEYEQRLARLQDLYAALPEFRRHTATLENAAQQLERIFSLADPDTLIASLDALRRLNTDRYPVIARAEEGAAYRTASNTIYLSGDDIAKVPAVSSFHHELGHWAYFNLLSNADRLEFWRSMAKFYDADGNLNTKAIVRASAYDAALRDAARGGATTRPQELFAIQFQQYMAGKTPGGETLWRRVAKFVEKLIAAFFGRLDGTDLDPDLAKLFAKIAPDDAEAKRLYEGAYATPPKGNRKAGLTIRNIAAVRETQRELELALNSGDPELMRSAINDAGVFMYLRARGWKFLSFAAPDTNKTIPLPARINAYRTAKAIHEALKEDRVAKPEWERLAAEQADEMERELAGEIEEAVDYWGSVDPGDEFLAQEGIEGFSIIDPADILKAGETSEGVFRLYDLGNAAWRALDGLRRELESVYRRQTGQDPIVLSEAVRPKRNGLAERYRRIAAYKANPNLQAALKERAERAERARKKLARREAKAVREAKEVASTPASKRGKEAPRKAVASDAPSLRTLDKTELLAELMAHGSKTKRGQQVAEEIIRRLRANPEPPKKVEVPDRVKALSDKQLVNQFIGRLESAKLDDVTAAMSYELWRRQKTGVLKKGAEFFHPTIKAAVQRELRDTSGVAIDDVDIPANAPEYVREVLRRITHRDPEAQRTARLMMYRMLNLLNRSTREQLGNTMFMTVEDVFRLAGEPVPDDADITGAFMDFRHPAFNHLRDRLRRLAVGINSGTSEPADVMHEIGHLTFQAVVSDADRAFVRRAFEEADDDIKKSLEVVYSDRPEKWAEEWFAEHAARYFAARVARNNVFSGAKPELRGQLSRILDMLKEAVAYVVNGLIGRQDINQMFRKLTVYGDIFGWAQKARPLTQRLDDGRSAGVSPIFLRKYSDDAFFPSSPRRKRAILEFTTEKVGDVPIVFYHGTPNGRPFGDRDSATLAPSTRGDVGPGIYVTRDEEVARSYAEGVSMTGEAMKRLVDSVEIAPGAKGSDGSPLTREELSALITNLAEVRDQMAVWRNKLSAAVLEAMEGRKRGSRSILDDIEEQLGASGSIEDRIAQTESHIGMLAEIERDLMDGLREYGVESAVLPLYIRATNPLDLTEFYHFADDEIDQIVEWLSAFDLVDPMKVRENFERRDPDGLIEGHDAFEALVESVMESSGFDDEAAVDAVNEAIRQAGYDSIRMLQEGRTPYGEPRTHEVFVLFSSSQVKHVKAAYFDAASDLLYERRAALKTAPTGAAIMAASESSGALQHPRMAPVFSMLEQTGVPPKTTRLLRKIARQEVDEESLKEAGRFNYRLQLRTNSSRMRDISNAGYVADWIAPVDGVGHFERHAAETANKLFPLLKQIGELPDAGNWLTNHFRKMSGLVKWRGEDPQPESHTRIVKALRRPESEWKNLSDAERSVASAIRQAFRAEHGAMEAEGLQVGWIDNYFPQIWNDELIQQRLDVFVDRLAEYFVRDSQRDPGRLPLSKEEARVRAERVAHGIVEGKGLFSVPHTGKRAPVADHTDYHRIINLTTDDLNKLGLEEFMHQNLGAILAKYFDGTTRRIDFMRKWGHSNHAFHDYMAVRRNGPQVAVDLLSSNKVITPTWKVPTDDGYELVGKQIELIPKMDVRLAQQVVGETLDIIASAKTPEQAKREALKHLMRFKPEMGPDYERAAAGAFAKRAEAIANGLVEGMKGGRFVPIDAKEAEFIEGAFRAMQRKPVGSGPFFRASLSFSKRIRNFNSVTLLPFTLFTSLTDMVLPLIRSGNLGAWAQGIAKWMAQPEYREAIRNIGSGVETVVHENLARLYGNAGGRFTNAFFNATILTPWTTMQREWATAVAFEAFRAEALRAQRYYRPGLPMERQPRDYKIAMRFLKRYGLEEFGRPEGPSITDLREAETNQKLQTALIKFANDTIFSPNPNDIPLWAQTPWGAIVFQLKSFPLMMGRLSKDVLVEAKNGNVKPLLYMLTIGTGFGMGSIAIKDFIQLRGGDDERSFDLRNRSFQQIAQEFGFDSPWAGSDLDAFLGWWLEGALHLGGLGMLLELIYNVSAQLDNGQFGMNRAWSYAFGPSVGLAQDIFNIGAGVLSTLHDDGNAEERAAVRSAAARIPVVGQVRAMRESAVDWIAGEQAKRETSDGWGSGWGGWGSGW